MKTTIPRRLIDPRAAIASAAVLIVTLVMTLAPVESPAQTPARTRIAQATPAPVQTPARTASSTAPVIAQSTPAPSPQTPTVKPAANLAVSDRVFVDSGDTKLFVEIRGQKKNAPVALVLHEGPGNPVGILAFKAYPGADLEKNFIVAYLHQRGVLRSPEVPAASQTLANHVRDIDSVVEYLKKRFGRDRISIVGHSWGGVLGYLYAIQHGAKIDKLVAVTAPFNAAATQFASYEMTLQWARDSNTQTAVDALVRLGPPPYRTSQELLQKTLMSADAYGGIAQNLDMSKILAAGDYTEYDPSWGDRQIEITEAMFAETQKINVENDVARVMTPLLLIGARNDAEVPYFSLKSGFDKWGGKKEFIVFEQSNHIVFLDEPDRFVAEVTRFLGR
ncbi:MAG: pip2 [Candidatus Krumholzibacteriota bacterium]|nr:pip2 [Candidatus Krumholzibacteriota bacterium]